MATVLALPLLFEAVAARLTARVAGVQMAFGWREPTKHVEGAGMARVTFSPGDMGGRLGDDLPPRNPGRNPRPIATLGELFCVYVAAYDPASPENELAQYTATRLLFDEWRLAMHVAAHGTIKILNSVWSTDKAERRFGAQIVSTCLVEAMIPDEDDGELLDVVGHVTARTQDVNKVFDAPPQESP